MPQFKSFSYFNYKKILSNSRNVSTFVLSSIIDLVWEKEKESNSNWYIILYFFFHQIEYRISSGIWKLRIINFKCLKSMSSWFESYNSRRIYKRKSFKLLQFRSFKSLQFRYYTYIIYSRSIYIIHRFFFYQHTWEKETYFLSENNTWYLLYRRDVSFL